MTEWIVFLLRWFFIRLGHEYHQIVLPSVNRCFRDTALQWTPMIIFWVVLPMWIWMLHRRKLDPRPLPISALFILRMVRAFQSLISSPLLVARLRSSPYSFSSCKWFWWSTFSSRPTKWSPSPILSVRLRTASLYWPSCSWWITIVERESSPRVYSLAFGFWFHWPSSRTWSIIPLNTNET